MADETAYDLERAEEIVDSVISISRRGDDSLRYEPVVVEEGLSVADIHENAQQFYDELNLLNSVDLEFPAVRIGGENLVPVSLSEVTRDIRQDTSAPWSLDFFSRGVSSSALRNLLQVNLRRHMRRFGEQASWLRPAEADKSFRRGARQFLASRFAGNREFSSGAPPPDGPPPIRLSLARWFGGPRTQVSGCLFSVHTRSPHLDAYWSGAYLIRSNYHGAPTTPAIGPLQAGTYVFGVNGGAYGSTVQWDLNKVCTLPGSPSVHLSF